MLKKTIIFSLLLLILSMAIYSSVEALDIRGEFGLRSNYDFDHDDYAITESKLELNFSHGSFYAGFNVDLEILNNWPEGETDINIKNAYFNYYADNYDLRLGKQLVNWGKASGFKPTDNINPPDPENPLDDKKSLFMFKGDYFIGRNYRLTGVLVPYHQPLMTGEVELSTADMPEDEEDIPVDYVTVVIEDTEYDLSTMEYAVQFSGRGVNGFDFSLNAYQGYETIPTLIKEERKIEGSPPETATVPAYYQRQLVLGADIATDIEGFGLWAEGAYHIPVFNDEYGSFVIGADYHMTSRQMIMGQLIYRQERDQIANYLIQLATEVPFVDYHNVRIAAFYNFETEGYLVRPELSFSLADAVNLDFEYIYQTGNVLTDSFIPVATEQNQLQASLTYSF